MSSKKPSLTHRERILLLLSRSEYKEEDYVAPFQICQDGISEILDIRKNNVSREMTTLEEEGLVEKKLARVKGFDRRRNIYLLMEKGEKTTDILLDELSKSTIKADADGVRNVTIAEAVELFQENGIDTDPFHIEEWMRNRDVLRLDDYQPKPYSKGEKHVEMILDAPKVEVFVGRGEELSSIKSHLEKEKSSIVVITGIAGIGKSTLAAQVMSEFKSKMDLIWYSFHPYDTMTNLKDFFDDYCKRANKKTLQGGTLPSILSDFIIKTRDRETLIFFDDAEKVPNNLKNTFQILLDHNKKGENTSAVIMSRRKLDFYDVRDVMNGYVHEVKLGPLSIDEVSQMFEEDIEEVYEKTGGHPLYLELVKKYPKEDIAMDEFIESEIYSSLTQHEKELLKRLSLLWSPIEKDVILHKNEEDALLDLKNKHLVEERVDGKISLHSIVKDFIHKHTSASKKKGSHKELALLMDKFSPGRGVETLYHYEKSGMFERALEVMKENIAELSEINESLLDDLIKYFHEEKLPERKRSVFYEVLGDIYLARKEWESAYRYYSKGDKIGGENTELTEKIAEVQGKLRKWRETIETHKKALAGYLKKGDKEGVIREYLKLGATYRQKGDLKEAGRYYRTAESYMRKNAISDARPILYNNKGMLYLDLGDYSKAAKFFKKALNVGGDAGTIHENLALLYEDKGDSKKHILHLEKAAGSYESDGSYSKAVPIYIEISGLYLKQGRYKRAYSLLTKSLNLERGRRRGILPFPRKSYEPIEGVWKDGRLSRRKELTYNEIDIHDLMAEALKNLGKPDDGIIHRKIALEGLKSKGDEGRALKEKLKLAFDHRDMGQSKKAVEILEDVERSADDMGVLRGLIAAGLEKVRILIQIGEYSKAERSLEEIEKVTTQINDKKGKTTTYKLMINLLIKMGKKEKAKEYRDKLKEV
ncbi:MAG: tetratricopeptide repeat protein [Thermoplasmata archaeon]